MKKVKLDWNVFLANKYIPMIKVDLDIQSFQNQVLIKLSLLRLVTNNPKKKSYPSRHRIKFEPTCFYYGIKGHTPNACYVRNFSVASGHYVWVKKGTNYEGPKATWVPNKT